MRGERVDLHKRWAETPLFEYELRGHSTPCWAWKRTKLMKNGYATWWVRKNGERVKMLTHRYMYELFNGAVDSKLDLDHLCRQRDCVRPDHLEPVSRFINVDRGAHPVIRNHELTHILDLRSYGFTVKELCKIYSASSSAMYEVKPRLERLKCR